MKLNKLMLATVIAFSTASVAQAASNQGSGTITFTGDIIDAPCSVAPESADQTVKMGQISSRVLANQGKSNSQPFSIQLKDCDITTKKSVKVAFTGQTAQGNNDLLGLVGSATGAGIQLIDGAGKKVALNGTPSDATNLLTGDNTLQFAAYLQGSTASGAVEPGDFTSVANFTLAYQ
ncbi:MULTISPECIES: fimbrial protein [unclassified Serratia (in: enterobacteria)]|uniref:fimbrial protein n=1 Tax=unclassified Serratia (in: enterobacteria) TaxID=2647522 RepID=UPI00307627EE